MANDKKEIGEKQSENTDKRKQNLKPPWKPGQSGNIHGRPKKENAWADVFNKLLDSSEIELIIIKDGKEEDIKLNEKNTFRHALGLKLIKEGLDGNVQAIRELADRTAGKPKQETESKIIVEDEEDLSLLTDEEIDTLIALKRKASGDNNK